MEVSILRSAPGAHRVRRLIISGLLVHCVLLSIVVSDDAAAFTLFRFSSGATVQLEPDDIFQGGAALGPGADQSFGQGTFPLELTDFSLPLDVNLPGPIAGGSLSTRLSSNFAFAVRLSRQERRDCINESDFRIQLNTIGSGGITSDEINGGQIEVAAFEPVYRGAIGRGCPNILLYGFTIDLQLHNAVAAGTYSGATEISVELLSGGAAQTAQLDLQIDMPSMMLLYHPDRIEIDLRAAAIAGLLGATSACGGDSCLDLGSRTLSVTQLGQPISADVSAGVPTFVSQQTITLRNAVAARSTGCTGNTYNEASFQVVNNSGGIQAGTGDISGLLGAPCGLELRAGDLSFDLDLTQASSANASATIQITVTGI